MIVDDDDIGLLQAVIKLLVVTVGHLRTICCELELIERKIQLFFKQNEACQHLTEIPGTGSDGGRFELVSKWLAPGEVFRFGAKAVVIRRKNKPLWYLQTLRCVSSKATDPWSQVALRDQGFTIGSMPVQIEAAADGPTQAEECCCGGDGEQKCKGCLGTAIL